ncbi:MAG: hypothetical protein DCC58_06050 [Chloroflexi bacterium]|nr:MAG: hypothetical protein DCC58_06050 [Chloroflexota bacterium]
MDAARPLLPFMRVTQTCERDGFPLIAIGDETYCSVEYADGLIGGQQVIGVWEDAGVIRLLFSSGYSLALTCPCCGGGLHLRPRTLADIRLLLNGRVLEGFRHGEWVGKETPPKRHPIFALQFAGAEERNERTIEVSLESVRSLRREDTANLMPNA